MAKAVCSNQRSHKDKDTDKDDSFHKHKAACLRVHAEIMN